MKTILLTVLFSMSAFAEDNRLNVQLLATADNDGNIHYQADATHQFPGNPACIRFVFSPRPPFKRTGLEYTVDRTRISQKYVKKYPHDSVQNISVYAQDVCTGIARGGDNRTVIVP